MKGYWHFPAMSAAVAALSLMLDTYWPVVILGIWFFILYSSGRLRTLPLFISAALFLIFYFYLPDIPKADPDETEKTTIYKGKIKGPVDRTSKKVEFILRDESSDQNLQMLYFPSTENHDSNFSMKTWKNGATCRFNGKLELPDTATNPGQFNYRQYLQTKGVTYQVVLSSPEAISCSGSGHMAGLDEMRRNLLERLHEQLSPETAAWLSALVMGDDSSIDEDTVDLFQRWGLSHILAISGLHVGLIIALVYFLLVKSNLVTKEKAQWVMLVFLPVYAFIAGGEPSVWRACMMVMLFVLLKKWKLTISMTDGLSIVFLLLLFSDPYIIYHIGFQFSFLVTFGLLLSRKWLQQQSSPIWQIIKISFVAQMIILPLQVTYFYTFHPLSIVLNVIVVPYFSFFVIPFLFILALVFPISGLLTTGLDALFVKIHHVILFLLEIVDDHVYFPLTIGSITTWETLLYFLLFVLLMSQLEVKHWQRSLMYGILTVFLIVGITLKPYFDPHGSITMLDIGQGDAFVIELPYRKGVFMYDAGAEVTFGNEKVSDENYKQVIKPYFLSRGITNIDAIFLSHEDLDHIGSVPFLVNEFDVKNMIISDYFPVSTTDVQEWKENGIAFQRASSGKSVTIGGQKFKFLAPDDEQETPNENSLVVYTKLGGMSWLFTGDIGKKVEQKIVTQYPGLTIDVLKVAHHGSKTSTGKQFLQAVNPKYGLVSVGRNNSYGHPSKEVVERLDDHTQWFRTDKNGAIVFRYRDQKGTFYKYLP